jgi:hypothetical protein
MLVVVFTLVISTVSGEDVEDFTECPDKSIPTGESCGAGGKAGTNCYRRRSDVGNPKWGDFPESLPNQDDICPRLPLGYACAYSFQCSTKLCCPYQKLCMKDDGTGAGKPIPSDKVVYPAGYSQPQGAGAVCTATAGGAVCKEGTFWFNGMDPVPDYVPDGPPSGQNTYDPSKCGCDPKFLEMLNAGTWVVNPADTTAASSANKGDVADSSKGGAIGWSLVVALVAERLI